MSVHKKQRSAGLTASIAFTTLYVLFLGGIVALALVTK